MERSHKEEEEAGGGQKRTAHGARNSTVCAQCHVGLYCSVSLDRLSSLSGLQFHHV